MNGLHVKKKMSKNTILYVVDECKSSPCLNLATCVDFVNGYACQCVPGYIGDICETDVGE